MFMEYTGNVGIGTTAPVAKLEIENSAAGSKTHLKIEQTAAASGDKFIHLLNTAGIAEGSDWIYAQGDDATDTFIVKGDGKVGIGIAAPTAKLHVVGDVTVTGSIDGIDISGALPTTCYIQMAPEFATAVLNADGSSNNGIMTSRYDSTHNCYRWEGNAANQDYDIYVKVLIPEDFGSWPSNSIKWYNKAASGNTTQLVITDTAAASKYDSTAIQNTAWTETAATITAGTFTPGQYMTMKFTVNSDDGTYAYIGEVLLTYTRSD